MNNFKNLLIILALGVTPASKVLSAAQPDAVEQTTTLQCALCTYPNPLAAKACEICGEQFRQPSEEIQEDAEVKEESNDNQQSETAYSDDESDEKKEQSDQGTLLNEKVLNAAKDGNVANLTEALTQEAHVNTQDAEGNTPLHHACSNGHTEIIKIVLKQDGINLEARNKKDYTPFLAAVYHNHTAIMELLLAQNPKLIDAIVNNDENKSGDNALHIAAMRNAKKALKFLISQGFNVNSKNNNNETALQIAVSYEHIKVVQTLASNRKVDINAADKNGDSPLAEAIYCDNAVMVTLLINAGAQIHTTITTKLVLNNARSTKNSYLHYAAYCNAHKTLPILLRYGLNVNARNSNKETPLHIAAHKGHIKIIKQLSAQPGIEIDALDHHRQTPCLRAIKKNHTNIIEMLLPHGKSDEKQEEAYQKKSLDNLIHDAAMQQISKLIDRKISINTQDADGETPLIFACKKGYTSIVQLLLEQPRINLNSKSTVGCTPFLTATAYNQTTIMELLLARDPSLINTTIHGNNALHMAAKNDALDALKLLISKGLDVNAKNNEKKTPLHIAARYGSIKSIKTLTSNRKSNINAVCVDGLTPLLEAVCYDKPACVRLLLGRGARMTTTAPMYDAHDFKIVNNNILHFAALNNAKETLALLLAYGLDFNAKNSKNQTPLHIAATKGHIKIVRQLAAQPNIEIDSPNNDGYTAFLCAVTENNTNVMELLLTQNPSLVNSRVDDDRADSALHVAARYGAIDALKLLIAHGLDVNAKNHNNSTPLHSAAYAEQIDIVKTLIAQPTIEIDSLNDWKMTPFLYAVSSNQTDIMNLLLSKGANINALYDLIDNDSNKKIFNNNAIHLAVFTKSKEALTSLIACSQEKGSPDINAQNTDGKTPVDYAPKRKSPDLNKILVNAGALCSPEKELCTICRDDESDEAMVALHEADKGNNHSFHRACIIAHLSYQLNCPLCRASFTINALNFNPDEIATITTSLAEIARKTDEKRAQEDREELLEDHILGAADNGNLPQLVEAITQGANVNAQDGDDDTPLHLACKNGHTEIVQILLEQPNIELERRNDQGFTPFLMAVKYNQTAIMQLFLDKNPNIIHSTKNFGASSKNNNGLHIAAIDNAPDALKLLIAQGLDVNAKNNNNETPLYFAIMKEKIGIIKILLDQPGIELSTITTRGFTPFMYAIAKNNIEIMELLLAYDPNLINETITNSVPGENALHIAIWGNHKNALEALKFLISRGLDVNKPDNNGLTPLAYAKKLNKQECVEILQRAGAME